MKVLCAYNVNLDAVHTVEGEHLSGLLQASGIALDAKMPGEISSPSDFFSALVSCMREGTGAELLVNDRRTAEFIERSFGWSYRLGGNAGNMANVLASLGASPILNVPSLTPRLASMLRPGVLVPSSPEELASPEEAARDEEDPVHFVLQFRGGELVETYLGKFVSPRENRFIATFDSLNSGVYLDPNFRDYALKHIKEAEGALISGLHLVTEKNYREALDRVLIQVSKWKGGRPDLYIHAEMGSFQSRKAARYLLDEISADSIGMNEDELALVRDFSPGWRGIHEAALDLRRELGISRVCIHTRDFVISAIRNLLSPEDEVGALTFGAGVAATLVATGEVKGFVEPGLTLRPAGSDARDAFCRETKAAKLGSGAYLPSGDEISCLVPAFYVRHPKVTVGTGDTMTAATFYREIMALKR